MTTQTADPSPVRPVRGDVRLPHGAPALDASEVLHRPAILRAVRRRLDVSQRELAVSLRVAPSTVARAELADGGMELDLLLRVLGLAGLRLAVVDAETGEELPAEDTDTVHDKAGRRFPPHLDLHPHWVPALRRRDALPGRVVGYHRRGIRDYLHASGLRRRPSRHLTRPEVWWARLSSEEQAEHLTFTTWAGPLTVAMCQAGLGRYASRPGGPLPWRRWHGAQPGDLPPAWLRSRLRMDGPPLRTTALPRPRDWEPRRHRPQDAGKPTGFVPSAGSAWWQSAA